MSNNVGKFIFFAAGLVLGSVVTWNIAKKKYERIAQEEIDSVKEAYSKHATGFGKHVERVETVEFVDANAFDREKYKELTSAYGKAFDTEEKKKGEAEATDGPYVIPPDEFDENDYATISLTYFADGTLVDDTGDIVTNIEGTIGQDSLTHFGEYEEDSVFVRNDKLQIDYEILSDPRKYSDVRKDLLPDTASWC